MMGLEQFRKWSVCSMLAPKQRVDHGSYLLCVKQTQCGFVTFLDLRQIASGTRIYSPVSSVGTSITCLRARPRRLLFVSPLFLQDDIKLRWIRYRSLWSVGHNIARFRRCKYHIVAALRVCRL